MTEEEAVYAHCRQRQAEGREIDHAFARTIGAWWHDSRITATIAFTSTGYMTPNLSAYTFHNGAYADQDEDNKLALDMLGTYLLDRRVRNKTGKVPGWSDMWAVK